MPQSRKPSPALSKARLWSEFALLFLAAPPAIALFLPPTAMFGALFASALVGIGLLHGTKGFTWTELTHGWRHIRWRFVTIFAGLTLAVGLAIVLMLRPEAFLILPRTQPGLMLAILCLYPFLSAFPQELVFRVLFFRRYNEIFPLGVSKRLSINAVLFSFAHLMYWSWVVALMTFAGGLVFAHSYEVRRSFPEAIVLHSVSGGLIFFLGLGIYFYSGNVQRPF